MASGYMPLFINVNIYFQPPPPILSIPQITILCATFISPFNLFLTAGCPLYVSLPSRSGQASSEFLLLRLVKKARCCSLSVHTFPLGKLLPS